MRVCFQGNVMLSSRLDETKSLSFSRHLFLLSRSSLVFLAQTSLIMLIYVFSVSFPSLVHSPHYKLYFILQMPASNHLQMHSPTSPCKHTLV